MNWLIDDAHLGEHLRTGRRPWGTRSTDQLFSTGYWYVRLCQALLGVARRGVLSGPFDDLSPTQSQKVFAAIVELPQHVGMLSLRDLAPVMGRLRSDYELNVLSSEALAAASVLNAHVLLSASSPRLQTALVSEGLRVIEHPVA